MANLLRLTILPALLLVTVTGLSQDDDQPRRGSRIIDDTTKQVYGPNTSKYYLESGIFFNRKRLHPIDTIITNFHRYSYIQKNNNLYQDLGNIGTAIRPIYYQSPEGIGVRTGAHVYDLYWDSEAIRYFDTKSPYSNMRVILGGKGRSMTRATFSRNINPQWNFGMTYRGLFIDKQIFRRAKGDRAVRSNYFDFYTAYQNKDSTYQLTANVRRGFHDVDEFGGVRLGSFDTLGFQEYFDVNALPWLQSAESTDLRLNYHLFHQFNLLGNAVQVYHMFDRYKQKNNLIAQTTPNSAILFDYVEMKPDTIEPGKIGNRDVTNFRTVRNEAGLKGTLGKLFYNGYYAIRHYSMVYNNLQEDTLTPIKPKGNEHYIGGRVSFDLDSITGISGWVEALDDKYRIQGEVVSKWFDARVALMRYEPGFVSEVYRGAHHYWKKNLENIESTQFNGNVHYRSSVLYASPGLTFTRLRNYVFFQEVDNSDTAQHVVPMQSKGLQILTSPQVRLAVTFFRHITLSNEIIYTKLTENADTAIRVPEVFINSQLAYHNIFFGGNLDMHAGVDVHWRSTYEAPAYDPAIRQFYNPHHGEIKGYPVIDLFFNAKIKRGRLFFKYHNLLQIFTKSGYLATPPGYPAQRNILDFGFDWSFYD